MGKVKNRLDKQLEMPEYADDAKDCLIIFNYLMEVDKGHIWESRWTPLVRPLYIGICSNTTIVYRPTDLGRKVIDSLKSNKATEYEIPSDKFKDGDTVEMIICKTQKGE
jgi:hypothetical protein